MHLLASAGKQVISGKRGDNRGKSVTHDKCVKNVISGKRRDKHGKNVPVVSAGKVKSVDEELMSRAHKNLTIYVECSCWL